MKIVYVEWKDASRVGDYHKDAPMPEDQRLGLAPSYSVGFVIEEAKEYISVAQTSHKNGWHRDVISIPRVSIIVEKVLMDTEVGNVL